MPIRSLTNRFSFYVFLIQLRQSLNASTKEPLSLLHTRTKTCFVGWNEKKKKKEELSASFGSLFRETDVCNPFGLGDCMLQGNLKGSRSQYTSWVLPIQNNSNNKNQIVTALFQSIYSLVGKKNRRFKVVETRPWALTFRVRQSFIGDVITRSASSGRWASCTSQAKLFLLFTCKERTSLAAPSTAQLRSKLVGALSPVNHKKLYQGCVRLS